MTPGNNSSSNRRRGKNYAGLSYRKPQRKGPTTSQARPANGKATIINTREHGVFESLGVDQAMMEEMLVCKHHDAIMQPLVSELAATRVHNEAITEENSVLQEENTRLFDENAAMRSKVRSLEVDVRALRFQHRADETTIRELELHIEAIERGLRTMERQTHS